MGKKKFKLIAMRKAAGWSQAELAERMGKRQQEVSRIESGTSGLSEKWLKLFSLALGVPASDLIDDVEPDPLRDRLIENFSQMNHEERQVVLQLTDLILSRGERN